MVRNEFCILVGRGGRVGRLGFREQRYLVTTITLGVMFLLFGIGCLIYVFVCMCARSFSSIDEIWDLNSLFVLETTGLQDCLFGVYSPFWGGFRFWY